jgi:predicted PurR-regulated permease PerM
MVGAMDYADLRRRLLWALLGVVLLAAIVFVLVRFRATLVFTIFLYYASRPIYRKLESIPIPERLRGYNPYHRQTTAVLTIILFLLPFLALLLYTLVLVIPELQELLGEFPVSGIVADLQSTDGTGGGLPRPVAGLTPSELLSMDPGELLALLQDPAIRGYIESASSTVLDSVSLLATLALHAFLLLAGTYYLLTDAPRLRGLVVENYDATGIVESYFVAVDEELSSILFGNILNAIVTGVIGIFTFTGYNLLAPDVVEVPFAPLVGALTGAGSLIPVVGMKIVYFPVAALLAGSALLANQPGALVWVALFTVLAFVVVDTIPDFLIRPYVSGNRTHIGLLMFAYILGPIAFGVYGIFLGPIILVLVAEFVRQIGPYVLAGRKPDVRAPGNRTLDEY